jgi:hypothetical protein
MRRFAISCLAMIFALPLVGCGPFDPIPPEVVTLAVGLNNPTGLSVLGGGTVVVAESGAGRLVTISDAGEITPFTSDFPVGTFIPYDIGPLSVLVQADGSIIVGEGGESIGDERVTIVGPDGVRIDSLTLTPISGGNFSGLAIHPVTGDLYIASANTNRVFRAPAGESGGFGTAVEFLSDTTLPPVGRSAPTALAFADSDTLLVGFGDLTGGGIARFTVGMDADPPIDEPVDGAVGEDVVLDETNVGAAQVSDEGVFLGQSYETSGIITALAVRPSDGAVFFSETEFDVGGAQGGRVAQLADDGTVVDLLNNLDGPSALAFASDGVLYVAVLGDTPNATAGSVMKITFPDTGSPADGATPTAPDAQAPQADGTTPAARRG